MRNLLFILLMLGMPWLCSAQYEYSMGSSAETLAERLQGEGVTILNPEVKCWDSAYGVYDGLGGLGIDSGIVLTNSYVNKTFNTYSDSLIGRSNTNWVTTFGMSFDTTVAVNYFRPLLASWDAPLPMTIYRTCAIEMDVVANSNVLQLPYVFTDALLDSLGFGYLIGDAAYRWVVDMGEECRCFSNTNIIGIFLSGPEHEDTLNFAIYPQPDVYGENVPVNRYTLRVTPGLFDSVCPLIYRNPAYDTMLWGGMAREEFLQYNTHGYRDPNINYPAFTYVMTAEMPVNPCDTYRLVLGVAEVLPGAPYELDFICGARQGAGTAMFLGKLSSSGGDSCMSLGVADEALHPDGVRIYPNPVGRALVVEALHADQEYGVQVYDMLGRSLYVSHGNAATLSRQLNEHLVPELVSGQVYFFVVFNPDSGAVGTIKLLKE